MKEQEVRKILDDPVTCEDGNGHCIDEKNKSYLVGEICRLFESKGKKPFMTPEEIIETFNKIWALPEEKAKMALFGLIMIQEGDGKMSIMKGGVDA